MFKQKAAECVIIKYTCYFSAPGVCRGEGY